MSDDETLQQMIGRHASEEHDARRSGASYAELAEMEERQTAELAEAFGPPCQDVSMAGKREPDGVTAANSLRLGLLGWQPEHRQLYRTSASFHAAIDSLINAAPYLVAAIAKSSREQDAMVARLAEATLRGPLTGAWLVPTLDSEQP